MTNYQELIKYTEKLETLLTSTKHFYNCPNRTCPKCNFEMLILERPTIMNIRGVDVGNKL